MRNLSAQGVNGFWPQTGGHAEFRQNDDGSREFALSLDHLMLADMVAWLGLFPSGLPPQAQALIESAVDECDRFYPAFQFALWGNKSPADALEAAMIDAAGEA